MNKILNLLTICSLVGVASIANASQLKIHNLHSGDIDIVIEAGEGSVLPTKEAQKFIVRSGEERSAEVKSKDFPKNNVFSILGKAKLPSTDNRCKGLFKDKDYTISFESTGAGGVVCRAEEGIS